MMQRLSYYPTFRPRIAVGPIMETSLNVFTAYRLECPLTWQSVDKSRQLDLSWDPVQTNVIGARLYVKVETDAWLSNFRAYVNDEEVVFHEFQPLGSTLFETTVDVGMPFNGVNTFRIKSDKMVFSVLTGFTHTVTLTWIVSYEGAPPGVTPPRDVTQWSPYITGAVWGGAIGAVLGVAYSVYRYKDLSARPVVLGTAGGAVLGLAYTFMVKPI